MERPIGIRGHRVQNAARAEARRRSVLMAAAQSFAEKGYVATTMDDIAERMETTKGAVYHYFWSKEEIFVQIRVTAIQDATERLEAIVARGGPPDMVLRAALKDLVSHIFGTVEQYAIVLDEPHALSAESRQRIRESQRPYERRIQDVVEAGIQERVFVHRDPKLMVFTLLRSALSVAFWYDPSGPLQPDYIVEEVVQQVLSGILTGPCCSDTALPPSSSLR